MRLTATILLGFATTCALGGCARVQHRDATLMAQCASALGDRPVPTQRDATAPRAKQAPARRASPKPVSHQAEVATRRPARAAVVQASAVERAACDDACVTCSTPCESTTATCPLCPLAACDAGADCMDSCCLNNGKCCLTSGECCLRSLFAPGPPPARYIPPMPPKFLPVPTQPIMSPARPDAPDYRRGDVEVGFRDQWTSPGRD